jgi:hypothetical protein
MSHYLYVIGRQGLIWILGARPLTGTKAEKSPYAPLPIDPFFLVLRAQIALTYSRRRTQVEFALYQGMALAVRQEGPFQPGL